MGRFNPKWSPAEKASFALVPETCPAIERAMDDAFKTPDFRSEFATEILSKYGITPDRNMIHALDELVGRTLFLRKQELDSVVRYQGTYPLRLALVRSLERRGGLSTDPSYYETWINDWNDRQAFRQSMAIGQQGGAA